MVDINQDKKEEGHHLRLAFQNDDGKKTPSLNDLELPRGDRSVWEKRSKERGGLKTEKDLEKSGPKK